MKSLNAQYWDEQYLTGKTGWDMGYASPPIVNYFFAAGAKESQNTNSGSRKRMGSGMVVEKWI